MPANPPIGAIAFRRCLALSNAMAHTPKMGAVFTSEAAAVALRQDARKRQSALPHLRSTMVPTPFGETHILRSPPQPGPTLLVLHGALSDATTMAPFSSLDDLLSVVLVDIPGEAPLSEARTLAGRDRGRWLEALCDAMGLDSVALLGMSGGGDAVLNALAANPARFDAAVLLVPQGIVPIGEIPWPNPTNAKDFVRAITAPGAALPPALYAALEDQAQTWFRSYTAPLVQRPCLVPEDLRLWKKPTLLFAGEQDAIFPGEALLDRAEELMPELSRAYLLEEANHVHADLFGGDVLDEIRDFLSEVYAGCEGLKTQTATNLGS